MEIWKVPRSDAILKKCPGNRNLRTGGLKNEVTLKGVGGE